ncbi:MAG TPA: chloride channel protein [Polyangia bacterium]|nr:chloride channel protein [Polyangia bacterium]
MPPRSRPSAGRHAGEAAAPWGARLASLGVAILGAALGGLAGGFLVVGVTLVLKTGIDFAGRQHTLFVLAAPLVGLALTAIVLHVLGTSAEELGDDGRAHPWRIFPPGAIRADISGDVVDTAGEEERFPWRLAPMRSLAIFSTVGWGCAMGTEAPAAYLGVAAGVCLGDRGRRWRRLLRPAAVAGGAAGVGALMGIALVGTAFILEMGRRNRAPLSLERVLAALVGGVVGWGIDASFGLSLIRLVVPHEPPASLGQAVTTALFIGAAWGAISSAAGLAAARAKKWKASPLVRLALGGGATLATASLLVWIASDAAAVGPGGGAISWAETTAAAPLAVLAVCALRAVATTAAVAAGGCGGLFVPFLSVGDLAGRVFAPGLDVGGDLAGAAGAAGGIAGGYRLPATAVFMVLGVGGPARATLTCLATVCVASAAGAGVEKIVARLSPRRRA